MSHQRRSSVISTASSAPTLHNFSPSHASSRSTSPTTKQIFRYPYPLSLTSLLDLAYFIYHSVRRHASSSLSSIACIRFLVLFGVVGCSRRWRNRGGLILLVSCATVGTSVWEGCADRLKRSTSGRHAADTSASDGNSTFLIVVSPYLRITECPT
jgi:hypothetical protein